MGTERTFALYNASDDTRLNIRIGDPLDEIVHLGFRTFKTNPLFYRIKAPDGTIAVPETAVPMTDGLPGRIIDYDQAVAGPNVLNATGYSPIIFDPSITNQTGDYSIEFRDPNHNPPGTYSKRIFELFDISVVETSTNTAIDGRLWSKSWDLTTNGSSNDFNGSSYIYTNDGITTKVGFNGFQPWSFIVQSNSTGPANSGVVTTDRQSIDGGILLPDYRIFLTEPDPSEFPISEIPVVTGYPNLDLCTSSSHYCINLELSNPGVVEYVIDIDGSPGFDDPRDVKLITEVVTGENCLPWDGLDGLGNPLTATDKFDIILSYQTGVTHLFIHDAEKNTNGFNVEHISPGLSTTTPKLFYDDSGISGATELDGCSSNCHVWTSNFGNDKTINTWWVTFLDNDTIKDLSINFSLVKSSVDIVIAKPVECDGSGLELEPNNISNAGDSPTLNWQINGVNASTNNTFSVSNVNEGDTISLIITPTELCIESDTATLIVGIPKLPIVSPDTLICLGDSVTISAGNIDANFRWVTDDVAFSTDSVTKIYTDQNRTYIAELKYDNPSVNLVVNGDFESGLTGFTTDYTLATGDTDEGEYTLGTNAQDALPEFYNLNEHTSGSGNMLIVNGNTVDGNVIYSTTVDVIDGKTYNFSAWATSIFRANAPYIQFYVNGTALSTVSLDLLPRWTRFNTFWTADFTGSVDIEIINRNTTDGGNDIALDDIVFGPIAICQNSVNITVVNPIVTTVAIKDPMAICSGDSLLLKIHDTTNIGLSPKYQWALNGVYQGIDNDSIIIYHLADNDSVSVITTSSLTGCVISSDTSFVKISVHSKPETSIASNPICSGDTALLNSTVSGATGTVNYLWTPNDSIIDPTLNNILAFPKSNTNYQVIVTDNNNCKDTATYALVVHSKPGVFISKEDICNGGLANLIATTTDYTSPLTHLWTPAASLNANNSNHVVASPTVTTTYTLTVEDAHNCRDTALVTVFVSISPNPTLNFTQDTTICETDPLVIKGETLSSGTLQWYKNDLAINEETSNYITSLSTGRYYLSETTSGCPTVFTDTIEVIIDYLPKVNAGESLVIPEGEFARLDGVSTGPFTWTIVSSATGMNIIEDDASLTSPINTNEGNSGKHILELCAESTLERCPTACDTLTVLIRGKLKAPNVFTPDGDGINDNFIVLGIEDYPEAVMYIHNRWGNIVYETDNYSGNEWNGQDSPAGVYFYLIDLDGEPGTDENFTGVIHLLK